jgi:alkylation response protein AidB-like acyl-CoA dehydrogenase
MSFELSRENRMILDAAREWAARECPEESVRQWDEDGHLPEGTWKKFLDLGFTGLCIPEAYGGEGPDWLGGVLVTEVLASRYPLLARTYGAITFYGGAACSRLGNEVQKKRILPALAKGERYAAVFFQGMDANADDPGPSLPVASGSGRTRISGSGRCTGPAAADGVLLFPAVAEEESARVQLYCVEMNREGLRMLPAESLGYKGDSGAQVIFSGMEATEEDLLGAAGNDAWRFLQDLLFLELGAEAVGIARASLEYAAAYARRRIQFGRPIARFPAIRDLIVENDCEIQAAAMLLYRAAASADRGGDWGADAARAYSKACRTARKSAMDGLQILGGYGYTMEFSAQRHVRDALSLYHTGAASDSLKARIVARSGI